MEWCPDKARFAKKVAEDNGYQFEFLDKGENCLFKISNAKTIIRFEWNYARKLEESINIRSTYADWRHQVIRKPRIIGQTTR